MLSETIKSLELNIQALKDDSRDAHLHHESEKELNSTIADLQKQLEVTKSKSDASARKIAELEEIVQDAKERVKSFASRYQAGGDLVRRTILQLMNGY